MLPTFRHSMPTRTPCPTASTTRNASRSWRPASLSCCGDYKTDQTAPRTVVAPLSPSSSLVADDGMRRIRLFKVCHLVLGQGDGKGADGSLQMCDLRCPDDGRRHRFLLQQPSKGDMDA